MKKKLLGLLITIAMSIPAYASISVAPTRLEINANKIRNNYATTAIEIKGDKTKAARYRVYSGYFKISDNSTVEIVDRNSDSYDLSDKIRYVPSEFTIPPGKTQKLRVNIANIKNLPDGESRAILYIEDVETKEINVPNNLGIGAQLILKTRVGVPVYVDKGKFVKKADIEYFNIVKDKKGDYTEFKINSTGNSRIRYNGIVQITKSKKLIDEYSIEGRAVGGNNYYIARDAIKTDKLKEVGEYTLKLIFYYQDENGTRKNIKKDAIYNVNGNI